jgi:signal peptidase I
MRRIQGYALIVCVAILAALALKTFVVSAIVVPSQSMEHTLLIGDYVLVDKLVSGIEYHSQFVRNDASFFRAPLFRGIGRGDVIVFNFPLKNTSDGHPLYYIKRVIAHGGDELFIREGNIYVNGEHFAVTADRENSVVDDYGPVTVPYSGMTVHLSHDNFSLYESIIRSEGHSIEDRSAEGFFVDGKRMQNYTVKKNYLFVLGDNLSHSYDSRCWGFLAEENVVGKAMMIYWSLDMTSHIHSLTDFFSSIRWNRIGTIVK